MSKTIRESQIRSLVKVLLEDKTLGPAMVKVNPVVDPSAALTDPANLDFKPQSRKELQISLGALIDDLPDDNIPDIYDSLKKALDQQEDEKGKEQMKKSNDRVEETVRLMVRKILVESGLFNEHFEIDPATGEHVWKGKGPAPKLASKVGFQKLDPSTTSMLHGPRTPEGEAQKKRFAKLQQQDFGAFDPSKPAPGRSRRNKMQEGDKLVALAKQLGYKNPNGAAQFINRTMERFRYNWENFDDVAVAMLEILKEYIQDLSTGGDLAPADVKILHDHPESVMDLDTFRIYAKKKLRQRGLTP